MDSPKYILGTLKTLYTITDVDEMIFFFIVHACAINLVWEVLEEPS